MKTVQLVILVKFICKNKPQKHLHIVTPPPPAILLQPQHYSQLCISEGANKKVVPVLEIQGVGVRQHDEDGSQSAFPFVNHLHQHHLPHQLLVTSFIWRTLRRLIFWAAFFFLRLRFAKTEMVKHREINNWFLTPSQLRRSYQGNMLWTSDSCQTHHCGTITVLVMITKATRHIFHCNCLK